MFLSRYISTNGVNRSYIGPLPRGTYVPSVSAAMWSAIADNYSFGLEVRGFQSIPEVDSDAVFQQGEALSSNIFGSLYLSLPLFGQVDLPMEIILDRIAVIGFRVFTVQGGIVSGTVSVNAKIRKTV